VARHRDDAIGVFIVSRGVGNGGVIAAIGAGFCQFGTEHGLVGVGGDDAHRTQLFVAVVCADIPPFGHLGARLRANGHPGIDGVDIVLGRVESGERGVDVSDAVDDLALRHRCRRSRRVCARAGSSPGPRAGGPG
jgi:hypothetical protein